jgi:hypothetical protein
MNYVVESKLGSVAKGLRSMRRLRLFARCARILLMRLEGGLGRDLLEF